MPRRGLWHERPVCHSRLLGQRPWAVYPIERDNLLELYGARGVSGSECWREGQDRHGGRDTDRLVYHPHRRTRSADDQPIRWFQFIPGFPLLDKGTEKFDPLTDPSGSTMGYTFGFFPYIGRITIELQEIGLQSISQRSGVRYHFEADVIPVFPTQGTLSTAVGGSSVAAINPQPQALRVVPLPGFDTYIFTEPIKDIHGLTLVFRSIDQIIPFPLDVITGVTAIVTSGTWPYLGLSLPLDKNDYGPTGRWIFNLVGLTRVFISGFQSGNAEIDNWVNQAPGMLSQIPTGAVPGIGINGLDTGSSTTDVNFTITLSPQVKISSFVPVKPVGATVVQIPSKTPITVRFSASRIRIPMRFRRVVQRLTTYGVM